MRALNFVVGTGRCGSTALSRVLDRHPDVLSVNELFSSLAPNALPAGRLTGAAFWELLAGPNPFFDAMVRDGTRVPEFLYPRAPGRFSPDAGIPALAMMVLPHLTDAPDALFDMLGRQVPSWPSRPVAAHYEALFGLLCDHFGRTVAVERSGFSLQWITALAHRFPSARIVHMYRDGPDCALSMSRHPGFRLIVLEDRIKTLTGVRAVSDLTPADAAALPPELAAVLPDRFDPAALEQPLPLAEFADLWTRLIVDGLADLAAVPAPMRSAIGYEDLVADPHTELARLAAFLGIGPDPVWLEDARTLLDRGRTGSARALPAAEFALLRERCAPGRQALEAAGAEGSGARS